MASERSKQGSHVDPISASGGTPVGTLQWIVAGVLAATAFVLGAVGFREVLPAGSHAWSEPLYRSLQLFVLEGGALDHVRAPVTLEIARLLAPAVATFAAAKALLLLFREQIEVGRIRRSRNHVVICGLGRKGLSLAHALLRDGHRVVVIEKNPDSPRVAPCRAEGVLVLQGDARNPRWLRAARVDRAQALIAISENDGMNAEIAARVSQLRRRRAPAPLHCVVQIVDPHLCRLLRDEKKGQDRNRHVHLSFFNIFESGARELLDEFPFFAHGETTPSPCAHIVVLGLGRFGRAVVEEAAHRWWIEHRGDGDRLHVTAFDRDAESKVAALLGDLPELEKACEIRGHRLAFDRPEFERDRSLFDPSGSCDVRAAYVCVDDESAGLSAGLALHHQLGPLRVPIVVRTEQYAGLASLLPGDETSPDDLGSLHAFPLFERTCNSDLLADGIEEVLARAIHRDYIRQQRQAGATVESNPSMVPWAQLSEDLKESSRAQARDIERKLEAIQCELAPLEAWNDPVFEFEPAQIEPLAEMEHQRWVEERRDAGWQWGPEKDLEKKTSPYLVPWNDEEIPAEEREEKRLPEEIKEIDRQFVSQIPAFVARAGFRIARRARAPEQS